MTGSNLFKPLRLPDGTVIPNRIAKAAMEENLATEEHAPGEARNSAHAADGHRGVRRKEVAERVVSGSVSMVGLATALAIEPALPKQWMAGRDIKVEPIVVRWKNKALASLAVASVVKKQLGLLSQGKRTNPGTSPLMALICNQLKVRRQAKSYRQWIDQA